MINSTTIRLVAILILIFLFACYIYVTSNHGVEGFKKLCIETFKFAIACTIFIIVIEIFVCFVVLAISMLITGNLPW